MKSLSFGPPPFLQQDSSQLKPGNTWACSAPHLLPGTSVCWMPAKFMSNTTRAIPWSKRSLQLFPCMEVCFAVSKTILSFLHSSFYFGEQLPSIEFQPPWTNTGCFSATLPGTKTTSPVYVPLPPREPTQAAGDLQCLLSQPCRLKTGTLTYLPQLLRNMNTSVLNSRCFSLLHSMPV